MSRRWFPSTTALREFEPLLHNLEVSPSSSPEPIGNCCRHALHSQGGLKGGINRQVHLPRRALEGMDAGTLGILTGYFPARVRCLSQARVSVYGSCLTALKKKKFSAGIVRTVEK